MKLSAYLKELLKKIQKAHETYDKVLWCSILEELDNFINKWLNEEIPKAKSTKPSSTNSKNVTSPPTSFSLSRGLPASTDAIDSSSIDKFNKDLLKIYNQDIPSLYHLEFLKKIVPLIGSSRFLISWWPKIFGLWISKPLKKEKNIIVEIIIEHLCDEAKTLSNKSTKNSPLFFLLLDLYCQKYKISKNNPPSELFTITSYVHISEDQSIQAQDFTLENLKCALIEFGDKESQAFYYVCSRLFKDSENRIAIAELLLLFLSKKGDQTYGLHESPLIEMVIASLLFDHCTNIVRLNTTILTMSLPYTISKLSLFFNLIISILGRLMITCSKPAPQVIIDKEKASDPYLTWEKLDAEVKENDFFIDIKVLFTFLYGMYPCNIKEFVCSPLSYLKKQLSQEKEKTFFSAIILESFIEEKYILLAGKILLPQHFLLPQMLFEYPEVELESSSRLLSIDPEEIVSKCLSTYHGCFNPETLTWFTSNSDSDFDFFSSLSKFTNKYEETLYLLNEKLSTFSLTEKIIDQPASDMKETDLNVTPIVCELYVQSFLRHHQSNYIRKFHREKVQESSTEAERHSLYSTCRALQQEVKILKETQEKIKIESNTSQSKHIKWENDLNQKLKYYRDLTKDLKSQNIELTENALEMKNQLQTNENNLQNALYELNTIRNQMVTMEALSVQLEEKETQNKQLSSFLATWDLEHEELLRLREKVRSLEKDTKEA